MDDHITFSAKYKSWITVKKMKIDENTDDLDIARLLFSVRETVNNKIYPFLEEEFNVLALEEKVSEIVPSGKLKEEEIAAALKALKSPKTTRMLKEFTSDKNKLEVYKGLFSELVLRKLSMNMVSIKALDKYMNAKNRRLG